MSRITPPVLQSYSPATKVVAPINSGFRADYYTDGVSDDVEIQSAVNAGTSVYLKGTFSVSSPISLKSNMTIFGDNYGATSLTSTGNYGGLHRGIFELGRTSTAIGSARIHDIGFTLNSNNAGIVIGSGTQFIVDNCSFTGSGTSSFGAFVIDTIGSISDIQQVSIQNNRFFNMPHITGIYATPVNGFFIKDISIERNHFGSILDSATHFDDGSGTVSDVRIVNNSFIDLIGGTAYGDWALAVLSGLNTTYQMNNILVQDNYYYNSRGGGEAQGFAWTYQGSNIAIINNTAITTQTGGTPSVIFLAPGRVNNSLVNYRVIGNYAEGWGAFWDPDSMNRVTMANNTFVNCGTNCLLTGYGTQRYLDIHDNTFYNCDSGPFPGFVTIGNASPVRSKVHDNTFIDDRITPPEISFIYQTGNNFDASQLEIYSNSVYMPNGTITNYFVRQNANGSAPQIVHDNTIHDKTGVFTEYVNAVGTTAGNITFNVNLGQVQTVTLNGNGTAILTAGQYIGQSLELRINEDGTGGRTLAWPTNFKKVGSVLSLTATASSLDIVKARYDGTNWIETSRMLNVG